MVSAQPPLKPHHLLSRHHACGLFVDIDAPGVAAVGLGGIEGAVGLFQQAFEIAVRLDRAADGTDADRHEAVAVAGEVMGNAELPHGPAQAFGKRRGKIAAAAGLGPEQIFELSDSLETLFFLSPIVKEKVSSLG